MILDLTPTDRVAKAMPKLGRRTKKRRLIRRMRETLKFKAAEVKPVPLWAGIALFGVLSLVGLSLGLTIATHVFFGLCILVGMIAVTENNRWIRHMVYKSNRTLDLIIFVLTTLALVYLGVTIVAGLTFASLGYTLVYAPYMRRQISNQ